MQWHTKALLCIVAAMSLALVGVWLMLRQVQGNLATCRNQAAQAHFRWQAAQDHINSLGRQVGTLTSQVTTWRTRALDADTATRVEVHTVIERLPPDCAQCAASYELDRTYINPGPDPPPATITLQVRDMLGVDDATWEIDMPGLCPTCPPCLPAPPASATTPSGKRLGMLAEVGVGYGIAGPEIGGAIYPLSYVTSGLSIDLGARVHVNMNDQGQVLGNALIELRLTKRGNWNLP